MSFKKNTKAERNTRLDRIGAVTSLGLLLAVAATIGISANADSIKDSTETNISQVEIQHSNEDLFEMGNTPGSKSVRNSVGNVPTP